MNTELFIFYPISTYGELQLLIVFMDFVLLTSRAVTVISGVHCFYGIIFLDVNYFFTLILIFFSPSNNHFLISAQISLDLDSSLCNFRLWYPGGCTLILTFNTNTDLIVNAVHPWQKVGDFQSQT